MTLMSHDNTDMSHDDNSMSHDTHMSHDDSDMSRDDTDDGVTKTETRAYVGDSPICVQVTWPTWVLQRTQLACWPSE
jgi:hypothetical protein